MFRFFSGSLMGRLVTLFLLAAIIPLGIAAVLSFHYSERALRNAAFNQLSSVDEIKKNQILTFLTERLEDLTILSKSRDIHKNFELLLAYHSTNSARY
ncbi:MAG: hypothetical protein R6X27_02110 [Candidatus Desulfacyla sp.]